MKKLFSAEERLHLSVKRVLIFLGLTVSLSSSLSAVSYEAIELGTLGHPDFWNTEAIGINDAGQVVGWSITSDRKKHAFIWDNGVMTDLGTLGGYESAAYGINENGEVIGWSRVSNGAKHAFIWDKTSGMRDIGSMLMAYSDCINESAQVVGWWVPNAFMWDPQGGFTQPWGSLPFIAYGINDMGQIVGDRSNSSMPVIWDNGLLTDLGTLGGAGNYSARAIAINNAGQVVGYSETSAGFVNPFLWDKENGMVNLVGITGETGWAFSINELGQVVGGSLVDGTSHVFLWDNKKGMVDLTEQLDLIGYLKGMDINNQGQIVAGQYLLSPLPEPAMVIIDVKPGSCPNPFNVESKGVLPVVILGTELFDVHEIDPNSVEIFGAQPIRYSYEDVAAPADANALPEECFCTTDGPDGYSDMTLKFDTPDIIEAIGEVEDGDYVILTLTGSLRDGTPIEGTDCVMIVKKGKE